MYRASEKELRLALRELCGAVDRLLDPDEPYDEWVDAVHTKLQQGIATLKKKTPSKGKSND